MTVVPAPVGFGSTRGDPLPMMAERGWDPFERNIRKWDIIQIVGIIAIIGLIAVLVVMRKKDAAGRQDDEVVQPDLSGRRGAVSATRLAVRERRADRSDSEEPGVTSGHGRSGAVR